eukprot:5087252-Pyramimonas_sp.AAC.1
MRGKRKLRIPKLRKSRRSRKGTRRKRTRDNRLPLKTTRAPPPLPSKGIGRAPGSNKRGGR